MKNHRLPEAQGSELHFPPQYFLRYLVAWLLVVLSIVIFVAVHFRHSLLEFLPMPISISLLAADILFPLVVSAGGLYLRGRHLVWDRTLHQIRVGSAFSGYIYDWKVVGEFAIDGQVLFAYCQAELQSLCVLSYRANGQSEWLVQHIYTDWDAAHAAADLLRHWEPRLQVEEVQDQSALPTLKRIKPLVD